MADNRALAASAFADALLGHLTEWTGKGSMEDDLTLLVADYVGL